MLFLTNYRAFNVKLSSFFIPTYSFRTALKNSRSCQLPRHTSEHPLCKNPTDKKNLIQFVGSVYVLMNLIMLLSMCFLSCPVKSSSHGVTQLVQVSCNQVILCWKRGRASVLLNSLRAAKHALLCCSCCFCLVKLLSLHCVENCSVIPFSYSRSCFAYRSHLKRNSK